MEELEEWLRLVELKKTQSFLVCFMNKYFLKNLKQQGYLVMSLEKLRSLLSKYVYKFRMSLLSKGAMCI